MYNLFKTFIRFPKIRKETAEKLYLYLMSNGDDLLGVDLNDKLSTLLSEKDWLEITVIDQISFEKTKIEHKSQNSE